jgi:hypothetical protein
MIYVFYAPQVNLGLVDRICSLANPLSSIEHVVNDFHAPSCTYDGEGHGHSIIMLLAG